MKTYEENEQAALFAWAKSMSGTYPELAYMHHIPNGGLRSKTEATRLQKQGVKPGVSDIFLPVPRGKYHGFYIEMKVKPNKLTKAQYDWLKAMKSFGYATAVCYSWIEAKNCIEHYLELK